MNQDQNETSLVDLNQFDDLCVRFKISLTSEELMKIKKLFGVQIEEQGDEEVLYENTMWQQQSDLINYRRLSFYLGLHKDSLNFLNKQGPVQSTVKKLQKLR